MRRGEGGRREGGSSQNSNTLTTIFTTLVTGSADGAAAVVKAPLNFSFDELETILLGVVGGKGGKGKDVILRVKFFHEFNKVREGGGDCICYYRVLTIVSLV